MPLAHVNRRAGLAYRATTQSQLRSNERWARWRDGRRNSLAVVAREVF